MQNKLKVTPSGLAMNEYKCLTLYKDFMGGFHLFTNIQQKERILNHFDRVLTWG